MKPKIIWKGKKIENYVKGKKIGSPKDLSQLLAKNQNQ